MPINNVQGVRGDISEMLSKLREISQKSSIFNEKAEASAPGSFNDVMSVVKNAVGNVNQTQVASEQTKNSYIVGDPNVSMAQVVLAGEKSKLAFEGLVTVRNKILEAYKEIMNMTV